jgi:putative ABC transport system permease protein
MRLRDSFEIAFKGFAMNRLRSFLTTLGIVIGIASVILMLSLGKGAEGLILGQIAGFGPDTIFVGPGGNSGAGPPKFGSLTAIKFKDVQPVRKLPSLAAVAPVLLIDAAVNYESANETPTTVASAPEIADIEGLGIDRGQFFNQEDYDAGRNVAVLGVKIASDLFGLDDPLGKTIYIKHKPFVVIGVMKKIGTKFFQNYDEFIYVPITAARASITGVDYINYIAARASGSLKDAETELVQTMRLLHKIDNPNNDPNIDDFHIETAVQAASILSTITSALTIFLAAIASISLLVGGIGIMNIMLVSVTERTREIGLRKAVGANRRDIMTQFIIEAVFLTMLGGFVGIVSGSVFSYIISIVISQFQAGWHFAIPVYSIFLSFGVAAAVGLVFGIYPARKAAGLNPIESLRYE